jgi:AcrR family transcriptional regulator
MVGGTRVTLVFPETKHVPAARRRNRVSSPKQERSRATLQAIVAAATRVFSEKGFEQATMSDVALTAGVSPGSLYQYAPTKGALAAHVMEARSAEIVARLGPRLLALASLPVAQAVRDAMQLVVDAHELHAGLPHVPMAHAPTEGPLARLHSFEQRFALALRVYLEAHRDELGITNLELATTITIHAVDAAVHAAMATDPHFSRKGELVDELTALVLGYLTARR